MIVRTFPGMFALRHPFFAPDLEAGAGETVTDEIGELTELPGDREAEPGGEDTQTAAAGDDTETASDTETAGGEDTQTAGSEGEDTLTATGEGEEEEEPTSRKPDWRDKQIIKARQQAKEEREAREAVERENAALKALSSGTDDEKTKANEDRIRTEAKASAREEMERDNYFTTLNKNIDAMVEAGEKQFPKSWGTRAAQAAEAVGEEMGKRPEFLETVVALDNAAAVYHDLANDPDHMEALLKMPAHKMAMEITKLSIKLAAAPKVPPVSRLPPPIKPLDAPGVTDRTLDELANDPSPLAQAEFDRRMTVEENKRFKAQQGR